MSFFKRLKDKFATNKENEEVKSLREEQGQDKLEDTHSEGSTQDVNDLAENAEVKKKPRKLSEADFDDDGLISIEDFEEIEAQKMGAKFKAGLEKSRQNFQEQLNNLIARYRKVDEDFFEALEEMLITADVGFNTVMTLTEELRMEAQRRNIQDTEDLREVIVEKIVEIYHQEDDNSEAMNIEDGRLNVILMVGVNGVGKTTTIGKLAYRYKMEGKKVMLAAGDTFRAGAIDQLKVWGERVGVDVISQSEGSDPAAVMYDAINAAKNKGVDILICDTAGRLQNKQI
ncbi:putative FtsY-like protein [Staphylococcus aureus subsp. aureus 21318]|nr:putative FtsY-like protein [Staphylococcus aureus subsp. aureus 21318]